MNYRLQRNSDKYIWEILKSEMNDGRYCEVQHLSFGPAYPGESERVIEQRARAALAELRKAPSSPPT